MPQKNVEIVRGFVDDMRRRGWLAAGTSEEPA